MADSVSIEVQKAKASSITVQVNGGASISVSNTNAASVSVATQSVPSISVSSQAPQDISVSSASAPGVSVNVPSSPSIEVTDVVSLSKKLIDLDDVLAVPEDGQTLVFDEDQNGFVFDFTTGGSGSLSADLESTNTSNVLGDANGAVYQEGDSLESILRDIVDPNDAGIEFFHLEIESGNGALTGEYVVFGTTWSVDSLVVRLSRNSRIPSNKRVALFINGSLQSQSPSFSDWSTQNEVSFTSGSHPFVPTPEFLEIRIPKSSGGLTGEDYLSKKIYLKKVVPIALYVSNISDVLSIENALSNAVEQLRNTPGFDYDGGHQYETKSSILKGSENSESSENFVYIAVPEDYTLESIAEFSSGVGVADMTNSFTLVSSQVFKTFPNTIGVDEYNVYLYRSNQTGALKSTSSLRVKVQ